MSMTQQIARVQAGVPTGGQFAERQHGEADVALAAISTGSIHSDFIDSSLESREAADAYTRLFPNTTATEFEDKLFDTWTDRGEYEQDLARRDSELVMLRDQLSVVDLPSGGVAVFFD